MFCRYRTQYYDPIFKEWIETDCDYLILITAAIACALRCSSDKFVRKWRVVNNAYNKPVCTFERHQNYGQK